MIESIGLPGDGVELHGLRAGEGAPLLLIHENRGLVPVMLDTIEMLASRGHTVVAPDLLSRIGGTAAFASDPNSISTRAIPEDTHHADLLAVYDWMDSSMGVATVLGICFGAEMGWRLITERHPDSAVLFYGIGPDPESAARISTRVYATYAQDDPRVNDTLDPLCEALTELSADVTLESFPGTKHAFADHTRPERHDPRAAAAMWDRALAFMRTG